MWRALHALFWVLLLSPPPALAARSKRASDDSPFAGEQRRFDDKALDALIGRLKSDKLEARLEAAKALLEATAADAPLLHRRLHRRTRVAPRDYRYVLRRIGAHVPNRHGRFGPPPKKKVDWLTGLLTYEGRSSPALREARVSVALMRGLAATRRSEAAISLLRFAYRHEGAFRDECGRLIRAMGDSAVPALVRARELRDELAFKMKRYAAYQLDRINRARPELALKHATNVGKAELLHAYGEVRSSVAVNAVVAHTDHKSVEVRRAARWAALRYVSGRAPRAKKRKLRLTGGRTTERSRSLYLTYRQLARHALADALAHELTRAGGARAGQKLEHVRKALVAEVEPRTIAERLFALYDQRRASRRAAAYRQADALARAGKRDAAIAAFDRLLAIDPEHPQRALMAETFVAEAGEQLARADLAKAARFATKALYLLSAAPGNDDKARRATRDRARAIRLVAETLGGSQYIDPTPELRRALSLWPKVPRAQDVIDAVAKGRERRGVAVYASAGGLGLFIVVLLLARRHLRTRRGPRQTPAPRKTPSRPAK
ncbi:MAG: hypothetical protein KC503_35045 [Myxococcales bacterium]|nr:hypothetical protein [Myxococcales bacterium]